MPKICQRTIKLIQDEGVTPRPRWHFLFRDCTMWCIFASLLALEVIIAETMLYILFDRYWDVHPFLGMGFWEYVFFSLPYFWIFLFLSFAWIAYLNFTRIKLGYRYPMYTILAGSVVGSVTVGSLLLYGGIVVEMHNLFTKQVPLYNSLVYSKEDIWDRADAGLLGGEIMEVDEGEVFMLKDFKGRYWRVQKELTKGATDNFHEGSKVRLIGKREGENMFYAEDIRPWDRLAYQTQ